MLDRALAWAYLHETEDSFAIERETPSEDKARTFIALLHQAHDGRPLSESYLVELQNSVLTNPFYRAAGYRTEQNWLRGAARGAAGVTYDTLCRSGRLEKGLLLPVSVAMKRNEDDYLATLQSFSKPARERWSVRWIDEDDYDMRFNGHPAIYKYWDATSCVEFGYRMAEQALEVDLRKETQFLARYDRIIKAVDERFDVRGSDLATLVVSSLDNHGKVSKRRRKQYQGRVPEAVFDYIEELAAQETDGLEDSSG